MVLCGVSQREELLANRMVERALRVETSLDRAAGAAVLDPSPLESHGRNMAIDGASPSVVFV